MLYTFSDTEDFIEGSGDGCLSSDDEDCLRSNRKDDLQEVHIIRRPLKDDLILVENEVSRTHMSYSM